MTECAVQIEDLEKLTQSDPAQINKTKQLSSSYQILKRSLEVNQVSLNVLLCGIVCISAAVSPQVPAGQKRFDCKARSVNGMTLGDFQGLDGED